MSLMKKIIDEIDPFFTNIFIRSLDILGTNSLANNLRSQILRLAGFKIGKRVKLGSGVRIFARNDKLIIKNGAGINHNVYFDASGHIEIGENTFVGFNTTFTTSRHSLKTNLQNLRKPLRPSKIIVEDNVWIACNTLIIGSVRIGRGAVIGAGSVLTEDVPPYALVSGNPAKIIKYLNAKNKTTDGCLV